MSNQAEAVTSDGGITKDAIDLMNLNAFLSDSVEGHNLNFAKILAFDPEKKISIVGDYLSRSPFAVSESRGYWTLDSNLTPRRLTEDEKYYYGVSPKFDSREIISLIANIGITTDAQLDEFISRHADWFMTDERFSDRLPDFARYLVVAVCSHYGIKIRMSESDAKGIIDKLTDYQGFLRYEEGLLWVYGLPTIGLLDELDFRGSYTEEDGEVRLTSGEGVSIRSIYRRRSNIVLLRGRVFYSGVLLKPAFIERIDDSSENDGIVSYSIGFELSTYATVFSLDNDCTSHPLLESCRSSIRQMLHDDDELKCRFGEAVSLCGTGEELIEQVNSYLAKTCNVNQIGVSASMTSDDSYLIMGRRGGRNIDESLFYPSVNGNAEVADRDVSFYRTSVYEDYPTIRCDDYRIDFSGEISRETFGELSLSVDDRLWSCLGICMSGNIPERDGSGSFPQGRKRRMHFSIIFEQQVAARFLEIQSMQKAASEEFENAEIRGIKFSLFNDPADRRSARFRHFLPLISSNQDLVESVLLVLLVLGGLIGGTALSSGSLAETAHGILSTVLAVLVIIAAVMAAFSRYKELSRKRDSTDEVIIYRNEPCENVFSAIIGAFHGSDYHPTALAAITMYCADTIFRKFFSERHLD